ncbi:MAG: hypothetical protein AMS22_02475 [Thiotrichales bacterium SG8_50]|nr:MAG: hypothetical protein AMS22_02475 [Thiotrichales bacterium SG8_50]
METVEIVRAEQGDWCVAGELSLGSVPAAQRVAAGELLTSPGPWHIDLARVARSDSAGLALLVEWVREARERGIDVGFRHMPEQMRAMARVSGLEDILPLLD